MRDIVAVLLTALFATVASCHLLSEEPPSSGPGQVRYQINGAGRGTLSLPSSHVVSMGPEWRGPRNAAHCLECGCVRWWVGKGYLYGPCERHQAEVDRRWTR